MLRGLQVAELLMLSLGFSLAQTSSPATLTFTLDFPGSQPDHYSIRVESDGTARYESRSRLATDSEEEDAFHCDFKVSPATREKMFALAAKAGYFRKDLDSHRRNLASTGKKTLAYEDAQRRGESTYNYSPDPAIVELTGLFQGLSETLEFGHRIEYDHRYQKLALDAELKRLEESARSNQLTELAAIAPLLQQIVDDSSVINVSRARAQKLLEKAGR
jgi:hypothetical protein